MLSPPFDVIAQENKSKTPIGSEDVRIVMIVETVKKRRGVGNVQSCWIRRPLAGETLRQQRNETIRPKPQRTCHGGKGSNVGQ